MLLKGPVRCSTSRIYLGNWRHAIRGNYGALVLCICLLSRAIFLHHVPIMIRTLTLAQNLVAYQSLTNWNLRKHKPKYSFLFCKLILSEFYYKNRNLIGLGSVSLHFHWFWFITMMSSFVSSLL